MFTSWLRTTLRQSSPGKNKPGALSFLPGRRQNLTVTQKKSDIIQRQQYDSFSKHVVQKYQHAKELIPLVSKMERGEGFWGELERIFPNSGSDGYEEPAKPGELRRGTVIQKMNMFPKPGQTIADFKQQSEPNLTRPRKKEAESIKKPAITPGQRLFSRVTEVNPKVQPSDSFIESVVEPVKPDLVTATPDESGDAEAVTPKQETRMQEVENLAKALEMLSPKFSTPAQHATEPQTTAKEPLPAGKPLQQPPGQIKTAQNHPVPSQKAAAASQTKPAIHQPSAAKLLKAQPVKQTTGQPFETRKPSILTTTPQNKNLQHITPNPSASKVVQRSLDLPETPNQEEFIAAPLPVTLMQTPPAEPALQDLPAESKRLDLPLQKTVERQKGFARAVEHATFAAQTKSPARPALIDQQKPPLVNPRKYKVSSEPEQQPDTSVESVEVPQSPSVSELTTLLAFAQQKPSPSLPLKKEVEPARRQPRIEPQPVQSREPDLPLASQPKPVVQAQPQQSTAQLQPAARNVVQRDLPSSLEEDNAPAPSAPDYSKLAENVLPFVKHLLEIENERTRGSFR